ncbi:putative polynucleotide adenylyltransferase [Helianthus annuus]|nr:putative polynucleotide adenylyltransferase [Helianthus annuus]
MFIVVDWVKQLTSIRGYTDQMVEDANAVVYTFWIVHGPGADVDTLSVGPSYVNRDADFFFVFRDILSGMEEVTELQPIPDAHVPVMKFKFDGISIDLLYASVSLLVVPDHFRTTPRCLKYWAKQHGVYSNVSRWILVFIVFSDVRNLIILIE